MSEIKILLVEESAVTRRQIADTLAENVGFVVVGSCPSFSTAKRRAEVTSPNVVLIGASVEAASEVAGDSFRSLGPTIALGAVDFGSTSAVEALVAKIREVVARRFAPTRTPPRAQRVRPVQDNVYFGGRLIAIGASAGGTEALSEILPKLQGPLPPIVIVVHMPEPFTGRFAERLDSICSLTVREAVHGECIGANEISVARGGWHLEVEPAGNEYRLLLNQSPPVKRHRPSVDTLMNSVANAARGDGCGVMLTGMGSDGADGMLAMRLQGARTVAQDEETSAVYGMPRVATESGAAQHVVGLGEIPAFLHEWARIEEEVKK